MLDKIVSANDLALILLRQKYITLNYIGDFSFIGMIPYHKIMVDCMPLFFFFFFFADSENDEKNKTALWDFVFRTG